MLAKLIATTWRSLFRSGPVRPQISARRAPESVNPHAALMTLLREPLAHPKAINYETIAWVVAAVESANYMTRSMNQAQNLVDRKPLLDFALGRCAVSGLVMEFGVYRGESLRMIASRIQQEVHGFDSFQGLPEDWTYFQKKGRFSLGGEDLDFEAPNIRVHPGWFDQSVPAFLEHYPGAARFVHLDCDLYSSTKTVLDCLRERIVPGTVLVFDEYLNYPGWQDHEHRAFQEFVRDKGIQYEYLGFASADSSVAVRIVAA